MICKICGSTMSHLIDDLHICSQDTLISSDMPADKSIYDKSYEIKYKRYEKTETGEEISKARFELVHRYVSTGRLLDYGCGVGSFIKHCNYNGMVAQGFDINPYGDYCYPEVLLSQYDIVTFWDAIEHIENPVRLIKGLNPQYVFLCTPSTDDFKGRKSDIVTWRHYYPGEHVHYFNERSLSALLETCGYTVLEANYDESQLRVGGGDKNIISIGGKRV